ncbi:TPA: hypothetical protein LVM22_001171 [Klebsiella oxytoca]|nr:hypothetical protein [Klebsiella oxytoca]
MSAVNRNVTFRVLAVADIAPVIPGQYAMQPGFVVTAEITAEDGHTRPCLFVAPKPYFCDPADPELTVYCRLWGCNETVASGDVLDAVRSRQLTLPDGRVAYELSRLCYNEKYVYALQLP